MKFDVALRRVPPCGVAGRPAGRGRATANWRLLALAGLAGLAVGVMPVAAQAPADSRSLVPGQHDFDDELDHPRFGERVSHRGWEVRTEHFVVTSSESREQAATMAQGLEATWQQWADVADAWTTSHRDPGFAREPTGVMLVSEPVPLDRRAAPGPRAANSDSDMFVYLDDFANPIARSENTAVTPGALQAARGEMVQAMFRRTRLEARLAPWLRQAVAEWVTLEAGHFGDPFAAPPAPGTEAESTSGFSAVDGAEPRWRMARSIKVIERGQVRVAGAAVQSPPGERPSAEATERRPDMDSTSASFGSSAAQWLHTQLTAHDGAAAPAFLAQVAAAAASPPPVLRAATMASYARGVIVPPSAAELPRAPEPASFAAPQFQLAGQSSMRWQDQPVLVRDPTVTDEYQRAARNLVLLWKLARRFPAPARASRPRVLELRPAGGVDVSPKPGPADTVDLTTLAAALAQPDGAPWAMVDGQGQLLWSHDGARLANLFGQGGGEEPTSRRHLGRTLIEQRVSEGRTLVSWVEESPAQGDPAEASARWRVHVAWQPPTESPDASLLPDVPSTGLPPARLPSEVPARNGPAS